MSWPKWLADWGFANCRLTEREQRVLDDWRNGKITTERRKVVDVFDVANTHCVLGEWIKGRTGTVPYVTASVNNNSVSARISYRDDFLDRGNAIVIGGKTFVVTYQSEDFFSNDSHNLVLRLKDSKRGVRDVYLYLIAAINAGLSAQYSWGDSVSYKKIQKDEIVIPVTASGEIDFDFMALLVRSIIKRTIRGVVEWKNCEIAAGAPRVEDGIPTQPKSERALPVLHEIGDELKFREYLPVYSLKAACGPLAEGQEAEIEGWVKVVGHGKLDSTQFVVRTEDESMEGLIPEGAMCIMRRLGGGGLEGKTILVQRNDASDSESGGAYTIKKFTRKGKKVILKAKDPKCDIPLEDEAEYSQKYRALAEFKGILG